MKLNNMEGTITIKYAINDDNVKLILESKENINVVDFGAILISANKHLQNQVVQCCALKGIVEFEDVKKITSKELDVMFNNLDYN